MKPRWWSPGLFAMFLLGPACASNTSRSLPTSSLDVLVEQLLDSPRAQQAAFGAPVAGG